MSLFQIEKLGIIQNSWKEKSMMKKSIKEKSKVKKSIN